MRAVAPLLVLLVVTGAALSAQEPLPGVLVLGTGGTIAGEQEEPGTLDRYEITRTANEIVASIPVVERYARVETEQFANIPSPTITPDDWLRLARRINQLFETRPELAGIVVTHGTARLEETAFFLHLTVRSDRPVVMVGAQRPATGISPDGPLNLLSSIRVAASPESRGKGVMVVMDGRILSARDVKKSYARTGGFETGEMGMLGVVAGSGPEFFYAPVKKHTASSAFDLSEATALPRVDIAYSYAGADGLAHAGAAGVVVATTGFAPGESERYEELRRRGVVVASTFPSGEQVSSPRRADGDGDPPPVVRASHLYPTKARILMMLALTLTDSPAEIQRFFTEY